MGAGRGGVRGRTGRVITLYVRFYERPSPESQKSNNPKIRYTRSAITQ